MASLTDRLALFENPHAIAHLRGIVRGIEKKACEFRQAGILQIHLTRKHWVRL